MNGAQDMGGMHGFGPVQPEKNEPVFHGEWEKRAFALTLAMAMPGQWNLDMCRAAREGIPPPQYLRKTYYDIWFTALEKMMLERGLVTQDDIAAGRTVTPPLPDRKVLKSDDVAKVLYRGGSTIRDADSKPLFAVGDRVRTKNINPTTHTRLPRYVRGHAGTVERLLGNHVFPDSNSTGAGENPHWLYTVTFNARDLWGPQGDPTVSVSVDAWEPYLEKV
jgi:nitrile hydratase